MPDDLLTAMVSSRSVSEHYDAIMAARLSNEAIAEGLHALDLFNKRGSMVEGQQKLVDWYRKYSGG